MCKRNCSNFRVVIKIRNFINIGYKAIKGNPSTRNIQKGEKEVYQITDHFKRHKSVERVGLVKQLSSTIQRIKSSETKVIYIVGLPGTGKKELAAQYAEQQYRKLKNKGNSNIFVATVDASDPIIFHQHLFKIAEQMDIVETYELYESKTAKPGGYKDILLKLSSLLKNRSDWILVLNGLKFNNDLQWRVGERSSSTNEINRIKDLDLSDVFLPSPGELNKGTIIITTCDSFAKRHYSNNIKYLDMPEGMEIQETLQLLRIASGQKDLKRCEAVENVIQDLQGCPTSIYR